MDLVRDRLVPEVSSWSRTGEHSVAGKESGGQGGEYMRTVGIRAGRVGGETNLVNSFQSHCLRVESRM